MSSQGADIRAAIIGCGRNGVHKHVRGLATDSRTRIVAFCDLSEELATGAKAKATEIDPSSAEASVVTDWQRIVDDPSIDLVHISTANALHAPMSIAALETGKHVMCEKPMATTVADGQAMIDAARSAGRRLTLGHHYRFRDDSLYLKHLIGTGEVGRVFHADAWFHEAKYEAFTKITFANPELSGGGVLFDLATHSIDLAMWLIGDHEPTDVLGSLVNELPAWGDPHGTPLENAAFAHVRLSSGASMAVSTASLVGLPHHGNSCYVRLASVGVGAEQLPNESVRLFGFSGEELVDRTVTPDEMREAVGYPVEMRPGSRQIDEWITAILEDRDPMVTPEEALAPIKVAEAIYKGAGEPWRTA